MPRPALILALLVLLTACQGRAFSPPARIAPGDIAAATQANAVRVSGASFDGITGLSATGVELGYRRGLSEGFDVRVDASLLRLLDDSRADLHANIYALHAGLHYAPRFFEDHLALHAGLGGGGHAGGGFISPDLGLTLALDNRYLVPFASAQLFFSAPIAAETVDLSRVDEPLGARLQTPSFTWGWQTSVGAKLYIGDRSSDLHAALSLIVTYTRLNDEAASGGALGIQPAMELGF